MLDEWTSLGYSDELLGTAGDLYAFIARCGGDVCLHSQVGGWRLTFLPISWISTNIYRYHEIPPILTDTDTMNFLRYLPILIPWIFTDIDTDRYHEFPPIFTDTDTINFNWYLPILIPIPWISIDIYRCWYHEFPPILIPWISTDIYRYWYQYHEFQPIFTDAMNFNRYWYRYHEFQPISAQLDLSPPFQ